MLNLIVTDIEHWTCCECGFQNFAGYAIVTLVIVMYSSGEWLFLSMENKTSIHCRSICWCQRSTSCQWVVLHESYFLICRALAIQYSSKTLVVDRFGINLQTWGAQTVVSRGRSNLRFYDRLSGHFFIQNNLFLLIVSRNIWKLKKPTLICMQYN